MGGGCLQAPASVVETNPRRNPEGNVNVLDIGANIGWFTLLFAARGFTLWSVEPFDANLRLLRLSICLNQNFAEHIGRGNAVSPPAL